MIIKHFFYYSTVVSGLTRWKKGVFDNCVRTFLYLMVMLLRLWSCGCDGMDLKTVAVGSYVPNKDVASRSEKISIFFFFSWLK